jgi:hypothetical protein
LPGSEDLVRRKPRSVYVIEAIACRRVELELNFSPAAPADSGVTGSESNPERTAVIVRTG